MDILTHCVYSLLHSSARCAHHQIRLYNKVTIHRKRPTAPAILHAPKPRSKPDGTPRPTAFGKPRAPTSKAAKTERLKESRQLEKALLREHHGKEIYAYVNLRTGQVVYSLTKTMDDHKILSQLFFHGKRTKPPSIRRDHWSPYMAIRFPSTYTGLIAYHRLRELSLQRQLAPPADLVTTTKYYKTETEKRKESATDAIEFELEKEGKEFEDGLPQLLPQQGRAKKLMFQRETAVADVAFVVQSLEEGGFLVFQRQAHSLLEQRQQKRLIRVKRPKQEAHKGVLRPTEGLAQVAVEQQPEEPVPADNEQHSRGSANVNNEEQAWEWVGPGIRRRRRLKKEYDKIQRLLRSTKEAQEIISQGTKWGLERQTARRIALQHDCMVVDDSLAHTKVSFRPGTRVVDSGEGQEKAATSFDVSKEENDKLGVLIFWSDPRDATYARAWPGAVSHGQLERKSFNIITPKSKASSSAKPRPMPSTHRHSIVNQSVHDFGRGIEMASNDPTSKRPAPRKTAKPRPVNVKDDKDQEMEGAKVMPDNVVVLEQQHGAKGVWGWVRGKLGLKG